MYQAQMPRPALFIQEIPVLVKGQEPQGFHFATSSIKDDGSGIEGCFCFNVPHC